MEFKDIIRQLRNERSMNTTQLATKFEKTEAAIRAWESGRSKPDADTLIKLGEYFECSTDFLLGLSAYRNAAHHSEHKAVLDKAIGKFEDTFNKLDNRAQEEMANAFTRTISILAELPSHGEQGVQELIRITGYIGDMYEEAAKRTKEWSEQNLTLLIGACFTYRKNLDTAMEVMLEDYLAAHIENVTDAERRSQLAAMLGAFFPNNEKIKAVLTGAI
jgi:transcriptional regulator with XRE-family HTH domain